MKPNIDLQIDELILRDLPYRNRQRIAAALKCELTRLITEQGLPPTLAQGGNIPQIDIRNLSIPTHAKPNVIGVEIARQVYGNLMGNQTQEKPYSLVEKKA